MRKIAVFARWPEPGRVKTRLSPALPPELACALHRAMMEDALAAARTAEADERWLYWADLPDGADRAASRPRGAESFAVGAQSGLDLGERIERAFAALWSTPGDRVVVIGTDCPDLDATAIRAGFEALATRDLVLAPSHDGGYALIGLRRLAPEILSGVPWGGPRVLEATLRHAMALGLTTFQLPPLDDLDTPADLVRWIGREVAAPRPLATVVALRAIGLFPPALRAG